MLNIAIPENMQELTPKITVIGVGGAGGNAVIDLNGFRIFHVDLPFISLSRSTPFESGSEAGFWGSDPGREKKPYFSEGPYCPLDGKMPQK